MKICRMNIVFKRTLVLIIYILFVTNCSIEISNDIIVIKNVNVIPMDSERILKKHTVVIKDGTISEINKHSKLWYPKNYTVIDGEGKFLMPGLSDMHAHQWKNHEFVLFLANGITTIRNMWGAESHLINSGDPSRFDYVIPRLYTASPIIDGNPPLFPNSKVLTDPNEVDSYIHSLSQYGYHYIKVYMGLTEDIYFAILDSAQKYNIPVVGHIPDSVGIEKVLVSGQKSIEHMFGYEQDPNLYELTVKNGVWNCPTIVLFTRIDKLIEHDELEGMKYISDRSIDNWNSMIEKRGDLNQEKLKHQKFIEERIIMLKTMDKMGANFLIGTDCGQPYIVPGFSMHEELQYFIDAGLTPYEVLRVATYNAAEYLEILDSNGTIKIGNETDMILLEENPLKDIKNLKLLEGVVLRGKWLSRDFLDQELKKIELEVK